MTDRNRIIGEVIGPNSLRAGERILQCWTNAMSAAVKQHPLNLAGYRGQVVEVSGRLNDDLWEARFVGVIFKEGFQEVNNTKNSIISCSTGASMGWGV